MPLEQFLTMPMQTRALYIASAQAEADRRKEANGKAAEEREKNKKSRDAKDPTKQKRSKGSKSKSGKKSKIQQLKELEAFQNSLNGS